MFEDIPELGLDVILRYQENYNDIVNLCNSSRKMREYCEENRVWKMLVRYRYPSAFKEGEFKNLGFGWKDIFRINNTKIDSLDKDDENYDTDWRVFFQENDAMRDEFDYSDETYKRNKSEDVVRRVVKIFSECGKKTLKKNVLTSLGYVPSLDVFVATVLESDGHLKSSDDMRNHVCIITVFSISKNMQVSKIHACHLANKFVELYYDNPFRIYSIYNPPLRLISIFSLPNPPKSFIKYTKLLEEKIKTEFKKRKLTPKQRKEFDFELKTTFDNLRKGKMYCNKKWNVLKDKNPPSYITAMYNYMVDHMIYEECWERVMVV